VVWTLITTLTSTQRLLSAETLVWVVCCAMFFLSAVALVEWRSVHILLLPLIPAVVNAVIVILQRQQIWNPFVFTADMSLRLRTIGLLGNPDDVGALLVVPVVAAVVLMIEHRGALRFLYGTMFGIIGAALLTTETLSALVAAGAAMLALLLRMPRKIALVLMLIVALSIGAGLAVHLPIVERVAVVTRLFAAGNLHAATSARTQSYLAAWRMFVDHPVVGVGPGCFGFWYVPYWVSLFPSHPEFILVTDHFAESHNDHLQILATTGLGGYIVFWAALWRLASRRRPADSEPQARFVRTFAVPSAIAVGVLTLGLFPLELAAPTSVILYFAGVVTSWGGHA
jgi:O-antigen ligase